MIIQCISDLHGQLPQVPPADLLLIGGDILPHGSLLFQAEWLCTTFSIWLSSLPCGEVVAVAGNHDWLFERRPHLVPRVLPWHYLQDSEVTVCGLRIYGSPWQPRFLDWAFNLDEPELARKWARIPEGIDILLLHGPPHGYGDLAPPLITDVNDPRVNPEHVGSPSLRDRILEVRPKLTVFGHIHEGYGVYEVDGLKLVNASLMDGKYNMVNKPVQVELISHAVA